MEKYYEDFRDLQRDGLDALIITGANVTEADITKERFWKPMTEVMDWARENVTPPCVPVSPATARSCTTMASFARIWRRSSGASTRIASFLIHIPCCRISIRASTHLIRAFNDVRRDQMEAAGLRVLVASQEAGVLLAVSPMACALPTFKAILSTTLSVS